MKVFEREGEGRSKQEDGAFEEKTNSRAIKVSGTIVFGTKIAWRKKLFKLPILNLRDV